MARKATSLVRQPTVAGFSKPCCGSPLQDPRGATCRRSLAIAYGVHAFLPMAMHVLAVSLELATAKWMVALQDGQGNSAGFHTVTQADATLRLQAVLDLVERHRRMWSLPMDARIVVSCEAGKDTFWIYRALRTRGIECYVVDPSSIPVERQRRRAKTEGLDVIKLVPICAHGCAASADRWFASNKTGPVYGHRIDMPPPYYVAAWTYPAFGASYIARSAP